MRGPEREQPEVKRAEPPTLAELFPSALIGETPSSGESSEASVVQAYEFIVDPSDQRERRAVVLGFCMQAAALGYGFPVSSVILPGIGYRDQTGERPLSALYFFVTLPRSPDGVRDSTKPSA